MINYVQTTRQTPFTKQGSRQLQRRPTTISCPSSPPPPPPSSSTHTLARPQAPRPARLLPWPWCGSNSIPATTARPDTARPNNNTEPDQIESKTESKRWQRDRPTDRCTSSYYLVLPGAGGLAVQRRGLGHGDRCPRHGVRAVEVVHEGAEGGLVEPHFSLGEPRNRANL